jgi:hypothetical protein
MNVFGWNDMAFKGNDRLSEVRLREYIRSDKLECRRFFKFNFKTSIKPFMPLNDFHYDFEWPM